MNNLLKLSKENQLALVGFFLSFLLSPWIYYPSKILNSDGIFYLHLAYLADTQGALSPFSYYTWSFFPLAINLVHHATHLSFVNSAYLLQAFFMGLCAFFFVKITQELGASKRTQYLAILVFLSFETILNYRQDIFRDHGYWAFYLASFYFLIQFAVTFKLRTALCWFISSVFAIFFRAEGILLLLLSPFVVFFFANLSLTQKIKLFLKLILPVLLIAVIGIGWLLSHAGNKAYTNLWNQLYMLYYLHLDLGLIRNLHSAADKLNHFVLPKAAKQGSAYIILFAGLSIYFFVKLIWTLGVLNSVLVISSFIKGLIPYQKNQKIIMFWLLTITLFIPYNFLFTQQFLSTRYMIAALISSLLFVPFALDYCLEHPKQPIRGLFMVHRKSNILSNNRYFTLKNVFILYLVIAASGFIFLIGSTLYKATLSYSVDANRWLYANRSELTQVCSNVAWPLFALDQEKISYDNVDTTFYPLLNNKNCQYIVLQNSHGHLQKFLTIFKLPNWYLEKEFLSGDRRKGIYLFKRVTPSKTGPQSLSMTVA
ncbi:MAG: hypothetical protein K2Q14_03985 [Gammaproteobacteria bacterium]|nr:hypothetical protein [Gammaproteobacteria bacterium]